MYIKINNEDTNNNSNFNSNNNNNNNNFDNNHLTFKFNDNNIICCFSEGRNNIFKQYKINKNDLEIKQISENKDNKNEEIWKLQKINEKIFFIDNINRVNYLN